MLKSMGFVLAAGGGGRWHSSTIARVFDKMDAEKQQHGVFFVTGVLTTDNYDRTHRLFALLILPSWGWGKIAFVFFGGPGSFLGIRG
jgi:hypothetical protein